LVLVHIEVAVPDAPPTDEQLARWFPRKRETASGTFEIGLVLAGAVSAGAYTAGVLDYLFEALDNWHEKRRADSSIPPHEVVIRIITGASAGGMNGAIAASALHRKYASIPAGMASGGARTGNPFYDSWVCGVDIAPMLEVGDIGEGVPSVLNCDILDKIVGETLRPPGTAPTVNHAWVINPLPIILTVTNLRGVPYAVEFHGSGGTSDHSMTQHRDYMQFAVQGISPALYQEPAPDFMVLPANTDAPEWKKLGAAALASGAFPFGLKARVLERPFGDYDWRNPYFDEDAQVRFGPPAWPAPTPDSCAFLSVDGGVMNNEPFDLTHDMLAGVEGKNPRDGECAVRAIIMVDPFVDPPALGPRKAGTLLDLAGALLTAYQHQARYSPGDWALLQSGTVYSRFLVAPSRSKHQEQGAPHIQNDGVDGAKALASAELGAFLGFFSEHYRHHDFMLGRRNCQWFLKTVFTLPSTNSLFANWSAVAKRDFVDARDPTHLQIIPIVGEVKEALPVWPARQFAVDGLISPLHARFDAVIDALQKEVLSGFKFWPRTFFGAAAWLLKLLYLPDIFQSIVGKIRAAVTSIDTRP
jgi:hypothetical protein